jgi:hypothetical protein
LQLIMSTLSRSSNRFKNQSHEIVPWFKPTFLKLGIRADNQGCQMVYFQTKNPNLGKFWSVFQWKICW